MSLKSCGLLSRLTNVTDSLKSKTVQRETDHPIDVSREVSLPKGHGGIFWVLDEVLVQDSNSVFRSGYFTL